MKKNVIIDLKHISVKLGDNQVLDDLSLYIRDREFITLLGPSGCGKTTILRVIAGFLEPDEGDVIFEDKKINGVPPHKRQVNTIFQRYALFPHLNVYENIAFGMRLKGKKEDEIQKTVTEMLHMVNLNGMAHRGVGQLSGGQRQRIGIARALAVNPDFVVCDEPVSALDVSIQAQVINMFDELQEMLGLTYLFIAHDLSMVRLLCDRVGVMKDGKLVEIGETEQVFEHPQHLYTKKLLEAIPIPEISGEEQSDEETMA